MLCLFICEMDNHRGNVMLNHSRILSIFLCVSGLSACTTDNPPLDYRNVQTYTYTASPLYPEGYEGTVYTELPAEKSPVEVPDTYHVGAFHSPTAHKDMDRDWVNNQNAQGYTIELGEDEKAAQVANTLYKAPKNERTAEIKYQHNGKTYYKGLYGTYPSYEEAQKALNTLPADVKQKAGVKNWGSVQKGLNE